MRRRYRVILEFEAEADEITHEDVPLALHARQSTGMRLPEGGASFYLRSVGPNEELRSSLINEPGLLDRFLRRLLIDEIQLMERGELGRLLELDTEDEDAELKALIPTLSPSAQDFFQPAKGALLSDELELFYHSIATSLVRGQIEAADEEPTGKVGTFPWRV